MSLAATSSHISRRLSPQHVATSLAAEVCTEDTHGWLAAARGHCMHAFIDETVASVRACAWLCVAAVRARDIVVARFSVCIVAARA